MYFNNIFEEIASLSELYYIISTALPNSLTKTVLNVPARNVT